MIPMIKKTNVAAPEEPSRIHKTCKTDNMWQQKNQASQQRPNYLQQLCEAAAVQLSF